MANMWIFYKEMTSNKIPNKFKKFWRVSLFASK